MPYNLYFFGKAKNVLVLPKRIKSYYTTLQYLHLTILSHYVVVMHHFFAAF